MKKPAFRKTEQPVFGIIIIAIPDEVFALYDSMLNSIIYVDTGRDT